MQVKNNTKKRVHKNKGIYRMEEKKVMPFAKAFGNLKIDDGKTVKSVICELCKLSSNYFNMKKNGDRGLTEYEERVIRSTFQCFNIDAFTGETIQKP